MVCINEVGLNSFCKLKKLRLEHLDAAPAFDAAYEDFIANLRVNTTLTFVKLERVFTHDNARLLLLRDAIKASRVKKMVLWLYSGPLDATSQLS